MVRSLENHSQEQKNKTKKIFFLAGEHSGDLQGSIVIRHLKQLLPDLEITGVGGKLMKEAGMTCIHNSDEMAVIGIIEVIKNFKTLKHIKADIQNWLSENRPDMVVLIDYPDFNKMIADYNQLVLNRDRLIRSSSENSPKLSSGQHCSRSHFSAPPPPVVSP